MSPNMRILHIVTTMSPEGGGPQEAVRMIIRYAPPGYANEVVTLDDPAATFLATFPFPVHALGSEKRQWLAPKLAPWLRANRDRFDGVMLHGLWESTCFAMLTSIAGHKPYVVFAHGMLDPYFKKAFPAKHAKKWIFWLLAQYWVLRRAYRVLFTTAVERDLATQSFWLHRWNPMVVALGAEPPTPQTFSPQISTEAFYERCPTVRNKQFLLFLGRIHPKKGPDLLLKAFSAVARHAPNLHLVMAGPVDKKYQRELEVQSFDFYAEGRVHWPGMLQGEAKWGALSACDAFVLTSHQENFGIAVVEALACAKPVLITNPINIAPDILADGCGLVEPDTLEGATHLLQHWLALTPTQRAAMSQQALKTFAARYDMRHNAETILRVFDQLPASQTSNLAEAL
jgi:glycosyltransferase involved in cell wall biosynthesis